MKSSLSLWIIRVYAEALSHKSSIGTGDQRLSPLMLRRLVKIAMIIPSSVLNCEIILLHIFVPAGNWTVEILHCFQPGEHLMIHSHHDLSCYQAVFEVSNHFLQSDTRVSNHLSPSLFVTLCVHHPLPHRLPPFPVQWVWRWL